MGEKDTQDTLTLAKLKELEETRKILAGKKFKIAYLFSAIFIIIGMFIIFGFQILLEKTSQQSSVFIAIAFIYMVLAPLIRSLNDRIDKIVEISEIEKKFEEKFESILKAFREINKKETE
jgi:hypothetical protein